MSRRPGFSERRRALLARRTDALEALEGRNMVTDALWSFGLGASAGAILAADEAKAADTEPGDGRGRPRPRGLEAAEIQPLRLAIVPAEGGGRTVAAPESRAAGAEAAGDWLRLARISSNPIPASGSVAPIAKPAAPASGPAGGGAGGTAGPAAGPRGAITPLQVPPPAGADGSFGAIQAFAAPPGVVAPATAAAGDAIQSGSHVAPVAKPSPSGAGGEFQPLVSSPTAQVIKTKDASESGTTGVLRFTAVSGDSSSYPLTVYFTIETTSSSATLGTDYTISQTSQVIIPAPASKVEVTVTPIDDSLVEGTEQVSVEIDANPNYVIDVHKGGDAVDIADDDPKPDQATTPNNNRRDDSGPPPKCPCDVDSDLASGNVSVRPEGNGQYYCGAPRPLGVSNTAPHPLVSAEWTLPTGQPVPDQVVATLTFGGLVGSPVYYSTSGLAAGDRVRVALQADAATLATGRYAYNIEVKSYSGGTLTGTRTIGGNTEVFNWDNSPYGRGWWIDDLDRIVAGTGGVSIIRGDATAGWFASNGSGGYVTPAGSTTTLTGNSSMGWTLTQADGGSSTFNASGLLTARIDRNSNHTTYTYTDADGDSVAEELSQVTDPYGRVATYSYSGGHLRTMSDFNGRVTTFGYDASWHPTSVTQVDPDGAGPLTSSITTYTYDANDLITNIADSNGGITTLSYESRRIRSITYPGMAAQQITPVASIGLAGPGQGTSGSPAPLALASAAKATVTDAAGTTVQKLDAFGNPLEVVDPLGNVTKYERDANGWITTLIEPDADGPGPLGPRLTFYTYDSRGNLTGMTLPDGTTPSWAYDATFSQFTRITDEAGRTTTFTLDASGNRITEQDPLLRTTTYTYGSVTGSLGAVNGLLTRVTYPDPDGAGALTSPITTFAYDSKGRLTTVTYPGPVTRVYGYDATKDDLTSEVDELGRVTSYTYDAMGRLTKVTEPDPDGAGPLTSPVTTYVLDKRGLTTSVIDPLGRTTSYAYDSGGRLTRVTAPDPDGAGALTSPITTYAYDTAGRLTTIIDALGRTTAYGYDSGGRLVRVTQPDPDGAGALTPPITTYTYDNLNRLATAVDPLGRTTSYAYDVRDRLTRVTYPDPDGAGVLTSPVESYGYDAVGQLTSATDALGRITSYTYDSGGELIRVTQPDPDAAGALTSPTTTYTYDNLGRLTTAVDPLSRTTSYAYDVRDRLTTVTQPDPDGAGALTSPVLKYGYDAVGNLTTSSDALSRVTSYAYDNLDRLTTVTQPDPDGAGALVSPVLKYGYDAVGNLTTFSDALSRVTSYAYDSLDRLTTVTLPDPDGAGAQVSPVLKYGYDAVGNRTTATDALLRITTYAYDNLDRLTTVTQPDPDGAGSLTSPVLKYVYDAVGNLTKATDPLSRVTSYSYDNLDRLVTVTLPDPDGAGSLTSPVLVSSYDAVGNLIASVDPLSNRTTYSYDNLDRVTTVTLPDPDGAGTQVSPVLKYVYDAVGNRTAVVDANNLRTTYAFDNLDRVTTVTDPLNKTSTYSYDVAGQLTSRTDRLGRRVTFAYDGLGRNTAESWLTISGGTVRTLTYTYDLAGQLTGAVDPDATLGFAHDDLGRMTTATTSGGGTGQPNLTLTSSYDAVGNRTRLADNYAGTGGAGVTTYSYDNLDRQTTIQRGVNGSLVAQVVLRYNGAGQLTSMMRTPSGGGTQVNTTYSYDNLGRLTTLTHQLGTGTSLASYAYAYDAAGRLTVETNAEGTATYTYDNTGQLTGVDRPGTADDESYTYDVSGNRTMSGYATSGGSNRASSSPGYTYIYDDEGNLASKTETATGKVTTYAYDYRDRLVGVTQLASGGGSVLMQVTYTYDALDRRIGVKTDADGSGAGAPVQTWTVYDGENPYADVTGAGVLNMRYLYGPAVDMLLARTSAPGGSSSWYLTDQQGTVRDVASVGGTKLYHAAYDGYGRVTSESGGGGDRFKYTGREYDATTGLQYNRARYYDAAIGRWTQEDPIGFAGGDFNVYRYVANSPTNSTDPSGLDIWKWNWHHLLPKEVFTEDLTKNIKGLDINAKEYGWMLQGVDHQGNKELRPTRPTAQGIHPEGWNDDWQKWVDKQKGKDITKGMVDEQLSKMRNSSKYKKYFDSKIGRAATMCKANWDKYLAARRAAKEEMERKAKEKAAKEAAERAAKEATEKAAREGAERVAREAAEKAAKKAGGSLLKAGAKKTASAICKKIPAVGIAFFAYDACTGGMCYAINELTWPVSEAWRDDGLFD